MNITAVLQKICFHKSKVMCVGDDENSAVVVVDLGWKKSCW